MIIKPWIRYVGGFLILALALLLVAFFVFAEKIRGDQISRIDDFLMSRTLTVRAHDQVKTLSYADWGLSVDRDSVLAQLDAAPNVLMASFWNDFDPVAVLKSKIFRVEVSLDRDTFDHILSAVFPFLKEPDESHPFFFVRDEDQEEVSTFDKDRLISDVIYSASRLEDGVVNVEVFPKIVEASPPPLFSLSSEDIATAVENLKNQILVLRFQQENFPAFEWPITLNEGWVQEHSFRGATLNEAKLSDYLDSQIRATVERPVENATIRSFDNNGKAVRAEVAGIARDGVEFSVKDNVRLIYDSVQNGIFDISLEVKVVPGRVINETDVDLGQLTLIASGRSNFAGSPEGRAFNIQKGLNEKMNQIIVPPQASFSFLSFLGPVTRSAGWKNGLGIFGGQNLQPTPGGGLCQVSTTVYRAALYAGLPIEERKPHSLYVKYYKAYGEGLDSTIYSTGPDLRFLNDYEDYIFIQSYADGDEAYVNVYGTPDARSVTLEGPYRTADIPAEKNYTPAWNEIAWFRTIQYSRDRGPLKETISSKYRTLPKAS